MPRDAEATFTAILERVVESGEVVHLLKVRFARGNCVDVFLWSGTVGSQEDHKYINCKQYIFVHIFVLVSQSNEETSGANQ